MTFNAFGTFVGGVTPGRAGVTEKLYDPTTGVTEIINSDGRTFVVSSGTGYKTQAARNILDYFTGQGINLTPGMTYDMRIPSMIQRDTVEMTAATAGQQELGLPGDVVVDGSGDPDQGVVIGDTMIDANGSSRPRASSIVPGVSNGVLLALVLGGLLVGGVALAASGARVRRGASRPV